MTTPCSTGVRLPSASTMTLLKLPMKPWKSASCASRWMLHVRVVDEALLELLDELGRLGAAQRLVDVEDAGRRAWRRAPRGGPRSPVGQRQGGRHAGHAAADDQGGVGERHVDLVERLEQRGAGHGHAHQVVRLVGGLLGLVAMDPASTGRGCWPSRRGTGSGRPRGACPGRSARGCAACRRRPPRG